MSKRLEEFIKENKSRFDDLEPRAELWDRIEKSMPETTVAQMAKKREVKTFSLGFVMRVAAAVIVVMSACFIVYLRNEKMNGVDVAAINPVYARQQSQYISLIADKRSELKTQAKNDPQLYKEFSTELAQLDSVYKQLKSQLANSPNQQLVLRAMVKNLQVQAEVLNQQLHVIAQFNEMKKEEDTNEIKNI